MIDKHIIMSFTEEEMDVIQNALKDFIAIKKHLGGQNTLCQFETSLLNKLKRLTTPRATLDRTNTVQSQVTRTLSYIGPRWWIHNCKLNAQVVDHMKITNDKSITSTWGDITEIK